MKGSRVMYYYVQPGDSMHSIAKDHNTTVSNLMSLNPQISNPHRIHVGERIKVSSGNQWGSNRWDHNNNDGNQWGSNQWSNEAQRGHEEYRRGHAELQRGRAELKKHRGW